MDVPPVTATDATIVASGPSAPDIPTAASASAAAAYTASSSGNSKTGSTIAPAIAKLFASGGLTQPVELSVSYRVVKNPNEIVTVFSDPTTGKEVAQFPPELMVGIAEFFDHQQGVTLDRNA